MANEYVAVAPVGKASTASNRCVVIASSVSTRSDKRIVVPRNVEAGFRAKEGVSSTTIVVKACAFSEERVKAARVVEAGLKSEEGILLTRRVLAARIESKERIFVPPWRL